MAITMCRPAGTFLGCPVWVVSESLPVVGKIPSCGLWWGNLVQSLNPSKSRRVYVLRVGSPESDRFSVSRFYPTLVAALAAANNLTRGPYTAEWRALVERKLNGAKVETLGSDHHAVVRTFPMWLRTALSLVSQ